MAYPRHILCTIIACLAVYLTHTSNSEAARPCSPCNGPECNVKPEDCVYGTTTGFCGRTVCAKGPGMRCGGPSDILGKCGAGMQCKCERCSGCSLHTLTCDLSELLCLK